MKIQAEPCSICASLKHGTRIHEEYFFYHPDKKEAFYRNNPDATKTRTLCPCCGSQLPYPRI